MIGRQVALGGLLMVGARLITRLFDLATMLVLARLLLPGDFGLVAIAMTVVAIVEAALELPVNQALLRLPEITAAQYDTAFTLSALRALVLAAILLAAAWPFAWFYGDSRLAPLVCVLSLAPAARGMPSPKLAAFQKRMSFWRDFVIELAGKLVGFAIGFVVAMLSGSYWSIAAGTVAYPLTTALVSYGFAPYRPRLSLAEAPMFAGFVGWMSAAQVVSALNWQFERLLLGKLQATARLGLFTTAGDLANIPMLALFGPIQRPLLAAFTHLLDDRAKLARAYQTACAAILMLGIPLLVGECVVAEPLVLLLLGERWRDAIPLLRLLLISLVPGLFALPAIPLVMAFGQTRMVLRRNVIELCVKLPLVLAGTLQFGVMGVIAARVVSESVCALYCARLVRHLVGLPVAAQARVAWRPLAAALAMVAPMLAGLRAMPGHGILDHGQPLAMVAGLGAACAIGAASYACVLAGLWVLAGRPAGIEATVIALAGRWLRRARLALARPAVKPLARRAVKPADP